MANDLVESTDVLTPEQVTKLKQDVEVLEGYLKQVFVFTKYIDERTQKIIHTFDEADVLATDEGAELVHQLHQYTEHAKLLKTLWQADKDTLATGLANSEE